jgi:copper chaperone CopZ
MSYNFDKYREKREKVLGVKKRGVSFGTLAAIVSLVIILGLGIVVVPKSIAYFNTRHLDDVIYKLQGAETWPQEVITGIQNLGGVKAVATDTHSSRIVVTFDKTLTDTKELNSLFKKEGIKAILLNRISHTQRLQILEKEAKFEGLLK